MAEPRDRAKPFSRKHRRYWLTVTGGMIVIMTINVGLGFWLYDTKPRTLPKVEQTPSLAPPIDAAVAPPIDAALAPPPDAAAIAPADASVAPPDASTAPLPRSP